MIVLHLLPFGESTPLPPSDALNGESIGSRERTMDIILPLAFAWFRVRPFLSSSPLPSFQPIVFPHPYSTHSQSKGSTLTRSSTGAARHPRIHIQKYLPRLSPSRSISWATNFTCVFPRLPSVLRSRTSHASSHLHILRTGNKDRSMAQPSRASTSTTSPSAHGRCLAVRAFRTTISPSAVSVRVRAMIGTGCATQTRTCQDPWGVTPLAHSRGSGGGLSWCVVCVFGAARCLFLMAPRLALGTIRPRFYALLHAWGRSCFHTGTFSQTLLLHIGGACAIFHSHVVSLWPRMGRPLLYPGIPAVDLDSERGVYSLRWAKGLGTRRAADPHHSIFDRMGSSSRTSSLLQRYSTQHSTVKDLVKNLKTCRAIPLKRRS